MLGGSSRLPAACPSYGLFFFFPLVRGSFEETLGLTCFLVSTTAPHHSQRAPGSSVGAAALLPPLEKGREKQLHPLCCINLRHEEEMSLPSVAFFLVLAHGVPLLNFGAGAPQPGRAWCEWKAQVLVRADGIRSVGAEKAWG